MSGWIKLHRQIMEHPFYKKKREFSKFEAWLDMLLTVNFKDEKVLIGNKTYDCKRGQSLLSLESWAGRWGWGVKKVRLFLDLLQKDSMIELESVTKTTRITICNYDKYQDEGQAKDTQRASEGQAKDTQRATIEERKEDKERKEDNNNLSACAEVREIERISETAEILSGKVNSETADETAYLLEENEKLRAELARLKNKKNKSAAPEKEVVLPFDDPEFLQIWPIWKQFRVELKCPPYKLIGEQAALTELSNLSRGDPRMAVAIIRQSMAKGWKGLFELHKDSNHNGKPDNTLRGGGIRADRLTAIFEQTDWK